MKTYFLFALFFLSFRQSLVAFSIKPPKQRGVCIISKIDDRSMPLRFSYDEDHKCAGCLVGVVLESYVYWVKCSYFLPGEYEFIGREIYHELVAEDAYKLDFFHMETGKVMRLDAKKDESLVILT